MYVVLFGLFVLVLPSFLPKGRTPSQDGAGPSVLREMEETMEGFLAELEEDNKKLLDTIASMKRDHELSVSKLSDRVEALERQVQQQNQEWHRLTLQRVEQQEAELRERQLMSNRAIQAVEAARPAALEKQPEPPPMTAPPTIKSRYEDLFRMYEEGKSVEYIAKKSGMNKGEVSLIIQLAVQEEQKGAQE
jgi:TolA-binding protein